jgi:hypothetical protein
MYVLAISRELWAPPFMEAKTWGHPTSNIIESVNSLLLEERRMPIVELLNGIWHRVMDIRFKRLQDAKQKIAECPGQLSTDFALASLKESIEFSQHRLVQVADMLHGSVVSFSGERYTVNLDKHTCTCGRFQVNEIPCGHAVALINKLRLSPRDFIPEFFSLQTYRDTYSTNLLPVSVDHLDVCADCEPPLQQKPRGRPKERRLRKGERQRKKNEARAVARAAAVGAPVDLPDHAPQRCGQCGGVGHNKRSCRDVPQVPLVGARRGG